MAQVENRNERMMDHHRRTFNAYLTAANLNGNTDAQKQVLRDNVNAEWIQIQALNQSILNDTEVDAATLTRQENSYAGLLDIYLQLQLKLAGTPVVNNTPIMHAAQAHKVHLPKLNLPVFSGTYTDWPNFKDLFQSLVNDNQQLTNIEKFQYLKAAVTEQPARLLQPMLTSEASYQEAWNLLTSRYDNKRRIVNAHLENIFTGPRCSLQTSSSLRKLHDLLDEAYRSLQVLKIPVDNWDAILVYITAEKFDSNLLQLWERTLTIQDFPTFQQILAFLDTHARSLECTNSNQTKAFNFSNDHLRNNQPRSHFAAVDKVCVFCKGPHESFRCSSYWNLTPDQKWARVNQLNLCRNCLKSGHSSRSCNSSMCRKCNQPHHTSLHEQYGNGSTSHQASMYSSGLPLQSSTSIEPHVQQVNISPQQYGLQLDCPAEGVHQVSAASGVVLATAQILLHDINGKHHLATALLDSGSQMSFISSSMFRKLQVTKLPTQATVIGVGGTPVSNCKGMTKIELSSRSGFYKEEVSCMILHQVTAYFTPSFGCPIPETLHTSQLANPDWNKSHGIDVLLGAEVVANIVLGDIIRGKPDFPIAQNTKLGWILFGRCHSSNTVTFCQHTTLNADIIMQRFWESESMPDENISFSEEEAACEQHYLDTHYRLPSGKYGVKLPFKENTPVLGLSRARAYQQLLSQERKFQRNSKLQISYQNFMMEYQKLGHMKEIFETARKPEDSSGHYYLPHHGVFKTNDQDAKIRVVFNASAPTSNKCSLNENLHIGPNILNSSLEILLRFRTKAVALVSDIEKMYRQVEMHEEDQPYQRILWRNQPYEPIKEFQLQTVTYGTSAAPFLAIRTLKQLAQDYKEVFPEASKILLQDFYVDDCISGVDTIEEAISLCSQLNQLLAAGTFHLRKWASNEPDAIKAVPAEDKVISDSIPLSSTSILGLRWYVNEDLLCIPFVPNNQSFATKRNILSEAARLYDPLGLLSPVSIRIKILMQKIWVSGCQWDDSLPATLIPEWKTLEDDLKNIADFRISRFTGAYKSSQSILLCGFSDASAVALSAAVYIRVISRDGNITSTLLCSKTKVAPLKKTSIPRLELNAALLLSQLMELCRKALEMSASSIMAWTDSKVALCWIKSTPSKWKTYVANRVTAIQEIVNPEQWAYVKTKENPADIASRGTTANTLRNHKIWWKGPDWLCTTALKFTPVEENPQYPEEQRNFTHSLLITPNVPILFNLDKFSTLSKVVRVTAYCMRFAKRCQRKTTAPSFLTVSELDEATTYWIRTTQHQKFYSTIDALTAANELTHLDQLLSLSPFLDSKNILRVGGRIESAKVPYEVKHPILLPAKHPLTTMIIEDDHIRHCHAGPYLTQAALRQKFWIVKGRNTIRAVIHKCPKCLRSRLVSPQQKMADLPETRAVPSPPFYHCGIDYAGPLQIKSTESRRHPPQKAYVIIFICFSSRATHLELVSDASTANLVMAIQRFTSRRGLPFQMQSDQAPVFRAARKYYDHYLNNVNKVEIGEKLANLGIVWKLNPPGTPHFGGLWEANLKSAKSLLLNIMGRQVLQYEELTTLISKVEACLNSRPLMDISNDSDDLNPLTPGHFLIGKSLTCPPEGELSNLNPSLQRRWNFQKHLSNHFWNRWMREYLTSLQHRRKWKNEMENLKEDDLVLVKEKRMPMFKWPMGRITKVYHGKDDLVRLVQVKTGNGFKCCSLNKICYLPFNKSVGTQVNQGE